MVESIGGEGVGSGGETAVSPPQATTNASKNDKTIRCRFMNQPPNTKNGHNLKD